MNAYLNGPLETRLHIHSTHVHLFQGTVNMRDGIQLCVDCEGIANYIHASGKTQLSRTETSITQVYSSPPVYLLR